MWSKQAHLDNGRNYPSRSRMDNPPASFGIPELYTKVTDDAVTAKPLTVMEPQIYPESVPVEKIFSCDNKFLLLSSVTHASDFGVFMALEKALRTRSAVLR